MKDDDKIFGAFRSAASNAENHADFPAMDKVWQRLGNKLDQRDLHSGMTRWKKLAIAASILLICTIGYLFTIQKPTEIQVVTTDPILEQKPEVQIVRSAVKVDTASKIIIIEPSSRAIVTADAVQELPAPAVESVIPAVSDAIQTSEAAAAQNVETDIVAGTYNSDVEVMSSEQKPVRPAKSSPPLLVVDGKAISGKDFVNLKNITSGDGEVETLILDEPLYIINGVEYSEDEMFGPKPTSPYAPLSRQEIENVKVLQGKQAIDAYGEKGRKGVLIIKTKNGKPASSRKANSK